MTRETLEVIILVQSILVTVLGFAYGRSRKQIWRMLQLGVALAETETMKARDRLPKDDPTKN